MANGRPPDDGRGGSSPIPRTGGAGSGAVANESGLRSLGDRIEQSGRRGRRTRRSGRPRRTAGQRVLLVLAVLVAFAVVVAAAGYGYFRYEWSQITTAPCPSCAAVVDGAPYNVLVIGSDSRVGETAAEAQQFGNQSNAGGQRSDTIKIIHVDPQSDTASILSLPRDTFVTLSGVPASSGVSNPNKLNSAFAAGPNDPDPDGTGANGLVQTIQNTFGIPINHWIVVNFFGLMDAVNALGGVQMDVPDPIRDYGPCGPGGSYTNCSGLDIATTGCQNLTGAETLALSRSRDFEYEQDGQWISDPSGDIGRIERQNLIVEALVNKAKSTYNPIRAVSFISSLTHDVTLDNKLSATTLLDLAEKYHAFSGSALTTYTLPTVGAAYAPYGGEDVEIVQEPEATEMITQFLGTAPGDPSTPPLDQYGEPLSTAVPTGSAASGAGASSGAPASGSSTASPAPSLATTTVPPYDPRPC